MFKLVFFTLLIFISECFDHLLEGGSSIPIDEKEFNSRKKDHPKILLMIWDNYREEVVSDLMKWKKVAAALPDGVLALHYERNEHNRITERILPKAFPAYIFIEDEHYAYEFDDEKAEVEEILKFVKGDYVNYPKEHIPHNYEPSKKFKKSWPKLLSLVFFIIVTLIGLCCCFKFKNRIEDEDDQVVKRRYKSD